MRKGNILLTFILLIALAIVVAAFLFFVSGGLRGTTGTFNYVKSLYIAEAGLNKAIWYLLTTQSQGGQGSTWRVTDFQESYGGGDYTFSILDTVDPLVLKLISTGESGEVKRTIEIFIEASALPSAFEYALFNDGDLTLKGDTSLHGDVYAEGDMIIENPAEVLDGTVSVPEGSTIGGDGTYTEGDPPEDPPTMPTFDTAYYDNEIAFAGSGDPSVLEGDQVFNNFDTGGDTIYVNGDVEIYGSLTGGGGIVCTGTFYMEDASVPTNTDFISGGYFELTGNSNVADESLFYSSTVLHVGGNPRLGSTVLAPTVELYGTSTIYGLVYAWGDGVEVGGTVDMYGSICNPNPATYTGNISLYHEPQYLPVELPPGMQAGDYDLVEGSWKEI